MLTKEIKSVPFEVKLDQNKRTFEGYASVFGNKDHHDDIIVPGAFKKTIQERANHIKVLWQHSEPLGKPIHMEEDSTGLYVKGYVSRTALGNDALTLMEDGVVDRMSIGYDVIKDNYKSDARMLQELKLYEFSPVTFAANEEAAITAVKSMQRFENVLGNLPQSDLSMLMKEGRVISRTNLEKIKQAISALEQIINISEMEDEKTKQKDTEPPSGTQNKLDIDPNQLQSILSDLKKMNKQR